MIHRLLFFLSALDVGGAERQTIDLARRLAARGHDCRFLLFHRRFSPSIADPELLARTSFVDTGRRMLDPRSYAASWRSIAALAPDIVVGINATPTVVAAWGKIVRRHPARVVGTMHSSTLISAGARVHVALLRRTLPALDALVFVSANQRAYWEGKRLLARHATVIHNGIDIGRFGVVTDDARAAAKARLGLGPEDFVAGLLATFRPEKNHVQLIDAVAALRARGMAAKALFVGGGPTMAAVKAHALARGQSDHVVFAGEQSDVRPFVAAMDVGVLCSVAVEALSIAALETMAMGVPMVMSDIGGASEIVTDGVEGYLFPAGDTPALIDRLERVSAPAVRAAMSVKAAAKVRAAFTNTLMTDRYEALFDRVAAGNPG
jgi:glycosyltransferase involved in cell wall biosynthesis